MKPSKAVRIALATAATITAAIAAAVIYVVCTTPRHSEPDTRRWQTGYIFFSVGDSWKSYAVRGLTRARGEALTDSTPSHCGMVVMDGLRPLLVHESTSEGHIVAESPREYFEKNGSRCIYALPAPGAVDTLRLKADISAMLGARTPFDFDFNHSDSSALYCSELVVALLERNGNHTLSSLRGRKFIYPQDIADRCRRTPRH